LGEKERERGERERKKRRKKKGCRPNRYRRQGASLVGDILCYKGASDVDALQSTWHDPQVQMDP
jgi:hypothetical protein